MLIVAENCPRKPDECKPELARQPELADHRPKGATGHSTDCVSLPGNANHRRSAAVPAAAYRQTGPG